MRLKSYYELISEAVRKIYLKIKEDSIDSLAYLIDDGYKITCKDELRYIIVTFYTSVPDATPFIKLNWSNIKTDFITYLEYMNDKYNIQYIELHKYIPGNKLEEYNNGTPFTGRDKIITIDELENMNDFKCVFIKIAFNKNWKNK